MRSQYILYRQGLKIVKTAWIETCLVQVGEKFEQQYFTAAECNRAQIKAPYSQHLASRLAAKSAVFQVFDIQPDSPVQWRDIEIQNLPHGEPIVILYGRCQALAAARAMTKWLLSISHTPSYAAASAIALTAGSVQPLR